MWNIVYGASAPPGAQALIIDRLHQSAKLPSVSATKQIGIISLGVMGQRMLARLTEPAAARALVAWDPNPAVVAEVRQRYPGLRIAATPAEVIGTPGLDCVYIASPPASHLAYVHQAFDAGLAVFCGWR